MTLWLSLLLGADGHALIVSNNRSLDLDRPDLRYADDDGAQWAQLFVETLGPDRVQLLTRFDPESQLVHPDWVGRARPPSSAELKRAVTDLKTSLATDGKPANIYLVFAGHGDIDAGRGFLELEDARFTATDLEALIAELHTEGLDVEHIHIILDSCNSYFMLNPRSASVSRWEPPEDDHRSLLEKFPSVGAFISTSAEALTYEWSELQSGVFSYELRSGMRGAADVNGDGIVSYVELEGFVDTANRRVINELYRPRVFAKAPAGSEALIDLNTSNSLSLTLGFEEERRLTFRDGRGVRIMDVHKERDTSLTLRLPRNSAIEIVETRIDGQRPSLEIREVPEALRVSYVELESQEGSVGDRSASRLFRSLFAAPYGVAALEAFKEQPKTQATPFAVSLANAERLELNLRALKQTIRRQGISDMYRTLAFSTAPLVAAGASVVVAGEADPELIDIADLIAVPVLAFAAWLPASRQLKKADTLFAIYADADITDVEQRTRRVLAIESSYAILAEEARNTRRTYGAAEMAIGTVLAGVAATTFALSLDRGDDEFAAVTATYLAFGIALTVDGAWRRSSYRTPAETMWDLYQN